MTAAAARGLVAVIDIGKTNSRVIIADPVSGEELWLRSQRNQGASDPRYRALDVAGTEAFVLAALADAPMKAAIRTLVPVAHGACAALVAGDRLALPVADYEDPLFDSVAEDYRPLRAPFAETGSPFLPLGLNVGRQLFLVQRHWPEDFATADSLLFWPQYWAWRFSGVKAAEITSLGCHNDLWQPLTARPSSLAVAQGWDRLLPPLYSADAVLGPITPAVAAATGLDPATVVVCGIHDSNASFLRHRVARPAATPFVVLSSGTWAILLASGIAAEGLDERRDCLINVDALGEPTPSARFMGGREYEAIVSRFPAADRPAGPADLERVIAAGALALPGFAATGGPFQGHSGRLLDCAGLDGAAGQALASLYIALTADLVIDLLGARGDLVIEGPFAEDPLIAPILAALRPEWQVLRSADRSGSLGGALWLAGARLPVPPALVTLPVAVAGVQGMRARWRQQVAALPLL